MALGPLTLNITTGIVGRSFSATISGQSSGATVEVLGNDGTPGFYTANGRVFHNNLPFPINTVVLRETKPGEGYRDSRIDIGADGIALGEQGLSAALGQRPGILLPSKAPTMAIAGDSFHAYGYSAPTQPPALAPLTALNVGNLNVAMPFYLRAKLRSRIYTDPSLVTAVPGTTTSHLLSVQLPLLQAKQPSIVWANSGTNDIGASVALVDMIANATAFITGCNAFGAVVFWNSVIPNNGWAGDDTRLKKMQAFNDALFTLSRQKGVSLVFTDYLPAVMDYGTSLTNTAYLLPDLLHLNVQGSKVAADYLFTNFFDKIIPAAADGLPFTNLAPFDAVTNRKGNMLSNPMMLGNSGGAATGWGYAGSIPAITLSKTTDPVLTSLNVQTMTLGGTADGSVSYLGGTLNVPTGLKAGDVIYGLIEVDASALANLRSLSAYLRITYADATIREREDGGYTTVNSYNAGNMQPTLKAILRTPPLELEGVPTAMVFRSRLASGPSGTIAGTTGETRGFVGLVA